MTATTWRIGAWLNTIQSTFVGLLRVWSVPIVLMLSLASGYTTYYGLSFFIVDWIALIVTIAVQSIIVISTLELASIHWRANLSRYLAVLVSLLVALVVSVSFSYFKFYEFSRHDALQLQRFDGLESSIEGYLDAVVAVKSQLMARQQERVEKAGAETSQAYMGSHPAMPGEFRHLIGKGRFYSHFSEILAAEREQQKKLEARFLEMERHVSQLRASLGHFSGHLDDAAAYQQVLQAFQTTREMTETLITSYGLKPVKPPHIGSWGEFSQGITPSLAMWEDISLFALASAAMVDFFTLVLSYRLEFSAPGPLTEEEKRLAFEGLRQFSEFTINRNDELEFVFRKSDLERARRYSDWSRMFVVAMLLNRGFLRKVSQHTVEFSPNLYPVIGEQMRLLGDDASQPGHPLLELLKKKGYGA